MVARPGNVAIIASVACCSMAVVTRLTLGSNAATRGLEGAALLLAGLACITPLLLPRGDRQMSLPGPILAAGFTAWAVVQIDPTQRGAPLLNDLAILLFVSDVAILFRARTLSPALEGPAPPTRPPTPARVAATHLPQPGSPIAAADALVRSSQIQLVASTVATMVGAAAAYNSAAAYPWVIAAALVTLAVLIVHGVARTARRDRILAWLATGERYPTTPLIEAEVLRLQSPGHRSDLVKRLMSRLRAAELWRSTVRTARPPGAARMLASYAPLVHDIAQQLPRQPAPPVRAIAMLELLLSDGQSPLYAGDQDALGEELQRIAAAMHGPHG